MSTTAIGAYAKLIREFLGRTIDALTFEQLYLNMFKNEKSVLPPEVFETLDGLFADVDAFCPDAAIRGEDDLDEQQLRESCRKALKKLEQEINGINGVC